ncbi:hypothetical protein P20439_3302 [Pseudoalteromonas sp. BSi20439]|nr:hypothetical protein P20439_3302 [Pseudoalteromonas sp. BSi20439]
MLLISKLKSVTSDFIFYWLLKLPVKTLYLKAHDKSVNPNIDIALQIHVCGLVLM